MADNSDNTGHYLKEDHYYDDMDNDDNRRNNDNDDMDKKDADDVDDALLINKHQELNKKKEGAESHYGKSSTGNVNRQNRLYTPYNNTNSSQKFQNNANNMNSGANFNAERMLFKILLNKNQAGSVIGAGGSCIKELSDITNTSTVVSPMNNLYPGTSDRIAIFNGKYENVVTAVSLMIKAIGHNSSDFKAKNWDLKSPLLTDGSYDNVQIELKAVIPAAAAGIIIGQAGATLKLLSSTYSVEITVENKDLSAITKERLVVIKGTVSNIDAVLRDIMQKVFVDQNFKFYYGITNSNYPQVPANPNMMQQQQQHGMNNRNYYQQNPQQNQQQNYVHNPYQNAGYPALPNGAPRDPSIMTANLPIPDMLVGSLVGVQGAVINEIKRSSGASISVSKKGEYMPGTNNRNLTITGTPLAIQMAHSLIINKLKMLGYEC